MTAKTPTQRVEALRAERAALGIKRREVYAHDEDWPAIQRLANELQRKRTAPLQLRNRRSQRDEVQGQGR